MNKSQIHLGIIPDGNRRWAKQRRLLPWQGHEQGVEIFRRLIDWCFHNPDISVLTIWGFSTENWNRSEEEINQLMHLYEEFLRAERKTFHRNPTHLVHSGRRDRIPTSLVEIITEIEKETIAYTDFTLNFALDYGGRDEITRAINKITEPEKVTVENFRQYIDQPNLPDLDLIIRTSGEYRTSGFFIWEAVYAEWIFTDKYFPDLTSDDLAAALAEYRHRERRFGK